MGAISTRRIHGSEAGIVLVALFITLLPLLALVGTAASTLRARNSGILASVNAEKALLAAESGVDHMVHVANTTGLVSEQPITGFVGDGMSFQAVAKDLSNDGNDNDGDKDIDEEDEDAFEVQVTGTYRGNRRTIVSYIRPIMLMPVVESAMSFQDFSGTLDVDLDIAGNSFSIDGNDHKIDGSPGAAAPIPGMNIVAPGVVGDLLTGLNALQQLKVIGAGSAPSAAVTTNALDVDDVGGWAQSVANNYISPGKYTSFTGNFGSPAGDDWQVTFANGSLDLSGSLTGAGILVVMGDLAMSGTLQFTGLVIVTGNISFNGGGGGTMIRGGLIAGADVALKGTVDIHYSNQTLKRVGATVATKRVVTGWREVANP